MVSLPPHQFEEEATAHLLCPVRALACYVKRTEALRKSQQLFVHYREHSQGLPLTKQRLSHWLCDAITQAYVSARAERPETIDQRNIVLCRSAKRDAYGGYLEPPGLPHALLLGFT